MTDPIRRRQRRRWFVLVAAGLSATLTLLLLEGSCRLLGYGPAPPVGPKPIDPRNLHPADFIREAQLKRWVHPPKQVTEIKTDEHPAGTIVVRRNDCGFREDSDTLIEKPDGVFRILVLGDSHTDGICFNNESYANRLEEALNADASASDVGTRRKFEVINAGQVTFSPYQEWYLYEKVGARLSPDLVIVGMYAGNDYWDLMQRGDRVHLEPDGETFKHADASVTSVSEGDSKPTTPETTLSLSRRIKNVVRDHCATYHAMASIGPLRALFGNLPQYSPLELKIQQLDSKAHAAYWQSLGQAASFANAPAEVELADARWRHVVGLFQASAARSGSDLLFVVIPTLREVCPEVDPDGLSSAATTLELTAEQAALDARVRQLATEAVRASGAELIDLFDELAASRKTQPQLNLFYRFDHHLALDGHRVVADVLTRWVRQRLTTRGDGQQ